MPFTVPLTRGIIRPVSPPNQIYSRTGPAMLSTALSFKRYVSVLWLPLILLLFTAHGQQEQKSSAQTDDVVRVSSSLVQTDVMVFDKQGQFIDNLQREQFELRIDGKTQSISFFDAVKAGSISEDAQLAAARGGVGRDSRAGENPRVVPLDRGRTILFFVDDLHLTRLRS